MNTVISKPLVEISGMCKWYGDFSALHDINLTVSEGEKSLFVARPVQENQQ